MRLVVMGAGAIGSLLGGLLSDVGLDVTLVGRAPHIEAIRTQGLFIDSVTGVKKVKVKAEIDPSRIRGEIDIVLCTVKAYDTERAAKDAAPLVTNHTLFLCLQNGLDVEKEAAKVIPSRNVARGVTNNGALLVSSGHIKHTGLGDTFIGCQGEEWRPKVNELARSLEAAGLPTKVTRDIRGIVWSKVLVNVGINAIGAITHRRNGDLLLDPGLRSLMKNSVEEGLTIAQKLGINLGDEDVVEKTYRIAEATASNKNSMLQDIEKCKRTEVDFINGAIADLAGKLGLSTPINNTLTALIKGLESSTAKCHEP